MTKPKVLYLAAWGRSGTTIVDNILDAYPAAFSAGELRYLWRRGLLRRRHCGCGKPLTDCSVWRAILTEAFGADPPRPKHVIALQDSVRARHAHAVARRSWSPAVTEYATILARLYRAIHEVTQARLIVDSSKYPADAAVLARIGEVDAYLVHMTRDARAVAHSWARPTPHADRAGLMAQHGAARSTLAWFGWNLLIERIAPQYGDRYRRLRYEDLVADPQGEIESLLEFTGTPTSGGPFVARDRVRLPTNHTVSGNPRRFRVGDIDIRADQAWQSEQGRRARLVATAIGLPYLVKYRYPVRAAQNGSTRLAADKTLPSGN